MDHAFVIPAHGESAHLAKTLHSIREQSVMGSEVLIGTSTPSTFIDETAARFGVRVLVNRPPSGIAADWNFVLKASTARYITIAHQDDVYAPEYVQRLLKAAERHPHFLIAFSNYREHTARGARADNLNLKVKRWLCERAFHGSDYVESAAAKRRLLRLGNPICCPSVMLNGELLKDFEFAPGFKSNLDWDAWLRLVDRPGGFIYERAFLVSKGIHAQSETSIAIASRARRREDLLMFSRMWPPLIANLLVRLYEYGYRRNRTRGEA
jgi:glycosyltransferase involved in cell wall biosynthesis